MQIAKNTLFISFSLFPDQFNHGGKNGKYDDTEDHIRKIILDHGYTSKEITQEKETGYPQNTSDNIV